jgi:hypothetical protein
VYLNVFSWTDRQSCAYRTESRLIAEIFGKLI